MIHVVLVAKVCGIVCIFVVLMALCTFGYQGMPS